MFWKIIIGIIRVSEVIKSGWGDGVGIKGFTDCVAERLVSGGTAALQPHSLLPWQTLFYQIFWFDFFFACLVFVVVF